MTAAIEIYTRPGCGYCGAAKSLLTRKKAAFIEFDVASEPRSFACHKRILVGFTAGDFENELRGQRGCGEHLL